MMLQPHSSLQEMELLKKQCAELVNEPGVLLAFVIATNGQPLVAAGDTSVDMAGLSSLVSGGMAAADAIARIIGNTEGLQTAHYEGEPGQIFVWRLEQLGVVAVVFDQSRTLGWVRFQLRKRIEVIRQSLNTIVERSSLIKPIFQGLSDDEIENVFM